MSNRQARTSAREARARVQEEGQAATNQGVATGQEEEEEDEEEEEQHRRKRARKDTREWCYNWGQVMTSIPMIHPAGNIQMGSANNYHPNGISSWIYTSGVR
jgi:hypothetical protein